MSWTIFARQIMYEHAREHNCNRSINCNRVACSSICNRMGNVACVQRQTCGTRHVMLMRGFGNAHHDVFTKPAVPGTKHTTFLKHTRTQDRLICQDMQLPKPSQPNSLSRHQSCLASPRRACLPHSQRYCCNEQLSRCPEAGNLLLNVQFQAATNTSFRFGFAAARCGNAAPSHPSAF